MSLKRVYLLLIIIGIYTALMVNYPTPSLKALGYQAALNWYGAVCARQVNISILAQPGLRELPGPHNTGVAAVIPGGSIDYPRLLDGFLQQGIQAVVECSALDAWHTTAQGRSYLAKMRGSTYRTVVFDGGHHLPTLGLAPDIIILPVTNGYAAHAKMMDGISARAVVDLAREAGCPAVIAAVPRWGLVKAETSLAMITKRIIVNSPTSGVKKAIKVRALPGISSYGGIAFAYIGRDYLENRAGLIGQLDKLGMPNIHKIYLAFDYRYTDSLSADRYCAAVSRCCQLPVLRVNEPVKVANAILPWGVGRHELSQPGHSFENQ